MKNKLPAIKVYDIDYSFIIKNYLNPEMWQKTWTLFQYKTFVVTLRLTSINCQDEKINFEIKIKDNSEENEYSYEWGKNSDKDANDYAYYSLKINDLNCLKTLIESSVFDAISKLEKYNIIASEDYLDLKEMYSNEQDYLREIAEDFLDANDVSNEDIRETYIDAYVSNNTKLDGYLGRMLEEKQYIIFPDLYLMFANATRNDKTIKKWEKILAENNNIAELKTEIQEYLEYMQSEDFENDMNSNLEEI
jgi:hypothetical protein